MVTAYVPRQEKKPMSLSELFDFLGSLTDEEIEQFNKDTETATKEVKKPSFDFDKWLADEKKKFANKQPKEEPFKTKTITMEDAKKPSDPVNSPAHYTSGGIETIDFIEAKRLNFNLGNVVKYVTRAGKKDDLLIDLKKAKWYLDREIKKIESEK